MDTSYVIAAGLLAVCIFGCILPSIVSCVRGYGTVLTIPQLIMLLICILAVICKPIVFHYNGWELRMDASMLILAPLFAVFAIAQMSLFFDWKNTFGEYQDVAYCSVMCLTPVLALTNVVAFTHFGHI